MWNMREDFLLCLLCFSLYVSMVIDQTSDRIRCNVFSRVVVRRKYGAEQADRQTHAIRVIIHRFRIHNRVNGSVKRNRLCKSIHTYKYTHTGLLRFLCAGVCARYVCTTAGEMINIHMIRPVYLNRENCGHCVVNVQRYICYIAVTELLDCSCVCQRTNLLKQVTARPVGKKRQDRNGLTRMTGHSLGVWRANDSSGFISLKNCRQIQRSQL